MIRLWSGCQSVVSWMQLLLAGSWQVRASTARGDLWRWVWKSLSTLGSSRVRIFKAKAHGKVYQLDDDVSRWIAVNNMCADEAARVANVSRTPAFWEVWERHAGYVECNAWLSRHLVQHLVDCMQRWFQDHERIQPQQTYVPRVGRQFEKKWKVPEVLSPQSRFRARLGTENGTLVATSVFSW